MCQEFVGALNARSRARVARREKEREREPELGRRQQRRLADRKDQIERSRGRRFYDPNIRAFRTFAEKNGLFGPPRPLFLSNPSCLIRRLCINS